MSRIARPVRTDPLRMRRHQRCALRTGGLFVKLLNSSSIWAALAFSAVQASAAEPTAAQETPATESSGALEEVVVSATKREESLQRVPVSVNAISGDQLNQNGIVRLQDVQLPSLTVQEGGLGNNVFIR